jgi:site-specific DNA-methyltransferase (adenine-specific)
MSSAKGVGRDDWCTPAAVLTRVRQVGNIVLDPCTSESNPVDAVMCMHLPDSDGLTRSWWGWMSGERGLAFVNPPYSQMKAWAEKVAAEAKQGTPIIALVAARTDTRWWRDLWAAADVVGFWRGRLRFEVDGVPQGTAPFPSALIGCNIGRRRFEKAFFDVANVVVP